MSLHRRLTDTVAAVLGSRRQAAVGVDPEEIAEAVMEELGLEFVEGAEGAWRYATAWQSSMISTATSAEQTSGVHGEDS